jgi:hypothetical protein
LRSLSVKGGGLAVIFRDGDAEDFGSGLGSGDATVSGAFRTSGLDIGSGCGFTSGTGFSTGFLGCTLILVLGFEARFNLMRLALDSLDNLNFRGL